MTSGNPSIFSHEGAQETIGMKRAMVDKGKLIGFANDAERESRGLEGQEGE